MMRIAAWVGIGLVVGAAAWAGPYGTGGGSGRCPGGLAGATFKCTAYQSDGGQQLDCLRFGSANGASFTVISDALGSQMGCACQPLGKPAAASFGASPGFACSAPDGLTMQGRVKKGGGLAQVSATNASGGAYAVHCERDDACALQ